MKLTKLLRMSIHCPHRFDSIWTNWNVNFVAFCRTTLTSLHTKSCPTLNVIWCKFAKSQMINKVLLLIRFFLVALDSMANWLRNTCMSRKFLKHNYGRYGIFHNHNCKIAKLLFFEFLNNFFLLNRNPKELERAERLMLLYLICN